MAGACGFRDGPLQNIGERVAAPASQHGLDPQQETRRIDRFYDEVVRAGFEENPLHSGIVRACRDDHGKGGGLHSRADPLQHFQAVHLVHLQIQRDQVETVDASQLLERLAAVRGLVDPEAVLAQHRPQEQTYRRLIVDDQDMRSTLRFVRKRR